MARVYVPLSKGMTDEEVVQAFKDAAAKMKDDKLTARAEAEEVEESPAHDESDG
jgi:hypothetical protein